MTLDFKSLLDRSPNPYVTLDRDLTIVWANREYLKVTMRRLDDIVGRNLFEAYPSEGESYRQLRASFDRVLETGGPVRITTPAGVAAHAGGSQLTAKLRDFLL